MAQKKGKKMIQPSLFDAPIAVPAPTIGKPPISETDAGDALAYMLEGITKNQINATTDIAARVQRNAGNKRERKKKPSLGKLAGKYMRQNPAIWQQFCKFTWELVNAGCTRFGVALIFERIRYETKLRGVGEGEEFKINNNYRPYFARRFMKENPEAGEVFELRKVGQTREAD